MFLEAEFSYLCHIESENNLHDYIDIKSNELVSGRVCKKRFVFILL